MARLKTHDRPEGDRTAVGLPWLRLAVVAVVGGLLAVVALAACGALTSEGDVPLARAEIAYGAVVGGTALLGTYVTRRKGCAVLDCVLVGFALVPVTYACSVMLVAVPILIGNLV